MGEWEIISKRGRKEKRGTEEREKQREASRNGKNREKEKVNNSGLLPCVEN